VNPRTVLLLAVAIFAAWPARGFYASAEVTISASSSGIFSRRYLISDPNDPNNGFDIYHTIVNTGASFTGFRTTPESGTLSSGVLGQPGVCYTARMRATSTKYGSIWEAVPQRLCYDGPVRPERCTFANDCIENCPLVVNSGSGAWSLTGLENPVRFDLDADGIKERTGWTAMDSSLAFVALDRNGNGVIDDGSELFGNHTPLPTGSPAANGFEALRQYDSDHDGVITASDPIWGSLLLWTDRNHDGLSAPDELERMLATQFGTLETEYERVRRYDHTGNMYRFLSHCRRAKAREPYYDIFFRSDQ
jgi:hypothetical protein